MGGNLDTPTPLLLHCVELILSLGPMDKILTPKQKDQTPLLMSTTSKDPPMTTMYNPCNGWISKSTTIYFILRVANINGFSDTTIHSLRYGSNKFLDTTKF